MAGNEPQILTANRLNDGAVVYLKSDGDWTERFLDATVLRDETSAARALDLADRAVIGRLVIGPYLIVVRESQTGFEPTSVREQIRADRGPTIAVDCGSWSGRIAG